MKQNSKTAKTKKKTKAKKTAAKKYFYITLNGKKVRCREGQTILEVAQAQGIYIPTLCHHPDFKPKANCRVCVVEVEGAPRLVTSCSTKVQPGQVITTDSERVRQARNLNLELVFAEHIERCPECVWRLSCALLDNAERYKLEIKRFKDRKSKRKIWRFANAVEIDGTQCIDCRNCIEACAVLQNIGYLELKGKGSRQEVVPTKNKDIQCILCGQCTLHCPVGAAQEQIQVDEVEKVLNNKKGKVIVAQFAPSIRVSIGEEFNLPYGKVVTEQIVTGLRELGFDYVFDVNFGADITTMVEAAELLERIEAGRALPMFTSCCPAWINYVEFYHPELIPYITTSRSPHIHNGGVIKTYWAYEMGLRPEDIIVVSIMPCTAKKFEASRAELKINPAPHRVRGYGEPHVVHHKGVSPVDYVLTTREFAWMLKINHLDLAKLKKQKADNPMGAHSGAAAIYGSSGGVMESALRTAQFMASTNKEKAGQQKIDFKQVRGLDDVKEAEVKIGGQKLRVAVVNGIGHIEPVLENMDKYHYIEVMACPGGCIGGGGQPIPTTQAIRQKRLEALYKIDKGKTMRRADENKAAVEILAWLNNKGKHYAHQVLYTHYQKRGRWKV